MLPELLGALLAGLASICFGALSVAIRKSTDKASVLEISIVVILINIVVFSLSSLFFPSNLDLIPILAFVGSGILATVLFRILFYHGVRKIGASRASAIKTSTPLFATLLAVLLLNETLTFLHFVGILILILGILFVSWEMKSEEKVEGSLKPVFLIILGTFFLSLEAPLSKFGFSKGVSVPLGLTIKSLTAFIGISLYLVLKGRSPFGAFRHSKKYKKWYLFAGLANTVGLALFYLALSIARVSVVSPVANVSPLFALVISYFFTPKLEKITWKVVVGAILVVLGAAIITIFM